MHIGKRVTTLALTIGLFSACSQSPEGGQTSQNTPTSNPVAASGKAVKVVASNSVLCDLTKQVAGNTVDLTCLIKPGSDPHIYQATPSDRKAIENAQLVLYGGYNFEPTLIKLIQASSNSAPKVAVEEVAVPTPQKFEEDGKVENDPHVFHNAQNGIRIVETIQTNLAKVAPENAEKIRAIALENNCPIEFIGKVAGENLKIKINETDIISVSVGELETVWKNSLETQLEAAND